MPRIKRCYSSQIQLCYISGAKVENESLVERLYVVFVGLLAHAFTYFTFHSTDCVFGDITKLTGGGWQFVLDTGINFIAEPQCHFFGCLYVVSLCGFKQSFAIWECELGLPVVTASSFIQPKFLVNLYGINSIAHLQIAPRSFKQRIAGELSNLYRYFVYELCTRN